MSDDIDLDLDDDSEKESKTVAKKSAKKKQSSIISEVKPIEGDVKVNHQTNTEEDEKTEEKKYSNSEVESLKKELEEARKINKELLIKKQEEDKKDLAPIIKLDLDSTVKNATIDSLLEKIYQLSLTSRQKVILDKYRIALREFENKLGTKEFEDKLKKFMSEEIEGKLIAAK